MEALYKNFFRDSKKFDPVLKALEKVNLVFKGSEQELINNTRKLNWPVKIDSRGLSKDPEQNI